MARFKETVNIRQVNLSTGEAQHAKSLSARLNSFSSQQASLAAKNIGEREQEAFSRGSASLSASKSLKDQSKNVPVIFGQSSQAYNKGLASAYIAGVDNDNRLEVARITAENPDNLLMFNDAMGAYRSSVLTTVDPAVQEVVASSLDQQITSARIQVQSATTKRHYNEAQSTLQANADSASRASVMLARNGDTVGSAQELQKAQASIEASDLPIDKKAKLKRDFERETTEQVMLHNIDNIFDEGGSDAAFEAIEELSKSVPKGWTPKEWDNFIGASQAEINQKNTIKEKAFADEQIEVSREISNLKIAAKTGIGNAGEIVKKTEQFLDDGEISGNERTSILTSLIEGQKNQRDIAFDDSQVAKKIAGNDAIVLSTKQIDGYYDRVMGQELAGMTPQQRESMGAEMVSQLKQIPTQMKNSIINGLRSENPDLIIESSAMIDRIDSVRGLVDRDFSATDRAFGRIVSGLSQNLTPEEAVRLALDQTNPNDSARVSARQAQLKEIIKDSPDIYTDAVESEFDPFIGANLLDKANKPAIAREYQALFDAHYVAGMDEANAKEKALQILGRNWGESSVTGKKRASKYRVEDYYSVAGSAEYAGDQLFQDVKQEFLINEEFTKEDLIILGTGQETARTASTGQPTYLIGVNLGEKGLIFFNGFDWKPDTQKQIDKLEKSASKRVKKQRIGNMSLSEKITEIKER